MYLMPLECVLKMVSFILYAFYDNFKKIRGMGQIESEGGC